MPRALSDSERRVFLQLSLMLCCGAAALLPLTAESSYDGAAEASAAEAAISNIDVPRALSFPAIDLSRDPFVPDADVFADSSIAAPDGDAKDPRMSGLELPPNAAAAGAAVPAFVNAVPVVRAVVLGVQSKALVETAGAVRVLGVGDRIGLARIASVGPTGILLSNGLRIPLEPNRR